VGCLQVAELDHLRPEQAARLDTMEARVHLLIYHTHSHLPSHLPSHMPSPPFTPAFTPAFTLAVTLAVTPPFTPSQARAHLLIYGGFCYFDRAFDIVGLIALTNTGKKSLPFEGPYPLRKATAHKLHELGRLQTGPRPAIERETKGPSKGRV
jgi:hypothetical protein